MSPIGMHRPNNYENNNFSLCMLLIRQWFSSYERDRAHCQIVQPFEVIYANLVCGRATVEYIRYTPNHQYRNEWEQKTIAYVRLCTHPLLNAIATGLIIFIYLLKFMHRFFFIFRRFGFTVFGCINPIEDCLCRLQGFSSVYLSTSSLPTSFRIFDLSITNSHDHKHGQ